jgi:hypothetical protein
MLNRSTGQTRLTKTKGFILASLVAGAMVVPLILPVQKAQADSENSERGGDSDALLGTWVVQVSVDPATVPPGAQLSFTELDTYGAGGGFVASNNGPGAGDPPARGIGLEPAATSLRQPNCAWGSTLPTSSRRSTKSGLA